MYINKFILKSSSSLCEVLKDGVIMFKTVCILLLGLLTPPRGIQASPFDLLDNYINNFQKEMGQLNEYLKYGGIKHLMNERYFADEEHEELKDLGKFDFIIVGGGASGSVIANRLSENPEWSILLLEAGGPETDAMRVPAMHNCLKSPISPFTWSYFSTPQNYSCLDMEERRCYIPTAKALGGSSTINNMVFTRGNARDYDLWADTGLKGWCAQSLAPYFKRIEDAHLECKMDHPVRHYGGPVHLETPRFPSVVAESFLNAAKEIDLHEIDLNGKNSLGFGTPQLMTKKGQRYGTNEAYLEPALYRKNLLVKPFAQVTKIIISEHTKEARGVKFVHEGFNFKATALKEVILAAGAINSAKLLLVSGVGPHESIHPVAQLQVGRNLIHQPVFPAFTFEFKDHRYDNTPLYYSKEIDYLRNGGGPLTSNGVDLIGFIKTEHSKVRLPYPDVELFITNTHVDDKHSELNRKLILNLVLLHPQSRGTLTHNHGLHIDLGDFSDHHEDDINTLLAAVRTTQKLLKSPHVGHLKLHHIDDVVPNCTAYLIDSDDYWRCAIKHRTLSWGSVSGTAPMGIVEKEGEFGDSVVDLRLRVHGVEKLRVADDSVVPVSISGHLTALKMVIGEKCADLIKEDWTK